ncbi:response regulator transcription factor [Streptomyces scabichelini]|uniref:response regulator transcription factor n=1 Tax=Streptomyces scabichelini TaxID=2711217 RepID=UPI001F494CEE|nr:response regulator transcription factor [Streptomyces scabichelini]
MTSPSTPARVLVVDDQAVVRAGFAAIVDADPDFVVVGEAGDGAEAVTLAGRLTPDVVLMDIRMPDMDGLTATGLLTGPGSGHVPKVLVPTTFDLDSYVYEALRAGASGFLLKDAEPAELLAALRVVVAGEAMLAPVITRRLIDTFAATAPSPRAAPLDALTPREREVLSLIATGHKRRSSRTTQAWCGRNRSSAELGVPRQEIGSSRPEYPELYPKVQQWIPLRGDAPTHSGRRGCWAGTARRGSAVWKRLSPPTGTS